jgi:broad specificity phosphatase PhoE
MDVALSNLGIEQASALGAWFNALPYGEQPQHILSSPYARARETAQFIENEMSMPDLGKLVIDERLREKELGALNRLTRYGIEALYPEHGNCDLHLENPIAVRPAEKAGATSSFVCAAPSTPFAYIMQKNDW